MELTSYVETLRTELAVAAAAGGEDARALAERLTAPLESAARLVLLEALTAAADEITRELAPGSVEVRLRGLAPSFVVTPPPSEESFDDAADAPSRGPLTPAQPDGSDGGTARINLRLPESLKVRAEEAASGEGLSVNAWLVRAVAAVVDSHSSWTGHSRRRSPTGGGHYSGWVH